MINLDALPVMEPTTLGALLFGLVAGVILLVLYELLFDLWP